MKRCYFLFYLLFSSFYIAKSINVILVSSYYPVTDCSTDFPLNQSLFIGIELSIIKDALLLINMTHQIDYIFECSDWEDIFTRIAIPNETLLGAVAGITITEQRMDNGFLFSQPTMLTGMSILFNNKPKENFITRAISWDIEINLLILPFVLSIIIYFFEDRNMNFNHYFFHAIGFYFHMKLFERFTLPVKFIHHSILFIMLILIALYTSRITNSFNYDKSYGGLYTPANIQGKNIPVLDIYKDYIIQENGIPVLLDSSLTLDEIEVYIDKQNIDYLATDGPITDYLAQINCNLYVALNNVIEYEFGMMTNPNSTNPLIWNLINIGLIEVLEQANNNSRWEIFLEQQKHHDVICSNKPQLGKNSISFNDMSLIWMIYVVILCFACFFFGIYCCKKSYKLGLFQPGQIDIAGFRSKKDKEIKQRVCNYFAVFLGISMKYSQDYNKNLLGRILKLTDNPKLRALAKKIYLELQLNVPENSKPDGHSAELKFSLLYKKKFCPEKNPLNDTIITKKSKNKKFNAYQKVIKFYESNQIFDFNQTGHSPVTPFHQFYENNRVVTPRSSHINYEGINYLKNKFKMDDDSSARIIGYISEKQKLKRSHKKALNLVPEEFSKFRNNNKLSEENQLILTTNNG